MGRARDRASADLNGQEFILDADADTSISADTDDQIDIKMSAEFGTLYTQTDKDNDDIPEGKQIGDVKEIKSKVKSIGYSVLYMKAVKALQEAMTRIETLEAKVKTLEDA